jgi:hypothetical protein
MGKNEDLTDFKGGKMENFADTSAFNAGVKEKNTKSKTCNTKTAPIGFALPV